MLPGLAPRHKNSSISERRYNEEETAAIFRAAAEDQQLPREQARGVTRSDGSLLQWTNGNLHVLLEPTENGQRLRFGTFNAAARASMTSGLMALGMAGVVAISWTSNGRVSRPPGCPRTLTHRSPSLIFSDSPPKPLRRGSSNDSLDPHCCARCGVRFFDSCCTRRAG